MNNKRKKLQVIPGVGERSAQYFLDIGIENIADLKGRDLEKLYLQLCAYQKRGVDRCMLYVFRCAVYFAQTKESERNSEKLKWWNWKD